MRKLTLEISILALLAAGCASFQVNPVLERQNLSQGYRFANLERPGENSEETFVIVTLSGGGLRAAALAYGVLLHLHDTRIDGGTRSLLDEVDVISSVSGGSFAAAYLGLFGRDRFLREFRETVLSRNIQRALVLRLLAPWSWPRLLSPRFGRSDLFNEYYDRALFDGRTYADLSPALPFVILNGADMSLGAQFSFTQDHFDRLCSDLSGVKVSRAVISSSAFPAAFTPLTYRNYPSTCGYQAPDWVDLAFGSDPDCLEDPECRGDLEFNPRRWDRARVWKAYEDAAARPFVHVVDGGVADNIGLREPLAAIASQDSPWSLFNRANLTLGQQGHAHPLKQIVVIVVDAKPRSRPRLDSRSSPPNVVSVLTAAARRPLANYSTDTVELLREAFKEWDNAAADFEALHPRCGELAASACRTSSDPAACARETEAGCRRFFALQDELRPLHPDLYRVHVRFDALRDPVLRRELQEIPTTLRLPRDKVDKLIEAAATLLDESEEYRRLLRDLG